MTWTEVRWGLQLIGEEGYGKQFAGLADEEDDAMAAAKRALGG